MAAKSNDIVISAGIVYRDNRGKRQYLLVKDKDGKNWEIPKTNVRRGESSVRAILRMMGESGGINARILEEATRFSGIVNANGKSVKQRIYYYLLMAKSAGEILGFEDAQWMEYAQAAKKLPLKKEQEALKEARTTLVEWEKAHSKNKSQNL